MVSEHKPDELPLEFITVTDQTIANKPNLASRQLVRAQARKAAYRNKGNDTQPRSKPAGGRVGGAESRFKLSSWKRDSPKTQNEEQSSGLAFIIPNQGSHTIPKDSRIDHITLPSTHKLTVELGPLNILPIPLTATTTEILHFYHFEMRTNSFALNPDGDWYDTTRVDAAALHALLSTIALLRQLQLGLADSMPVLHHRNEAVRLINEQLSHPSQRLSDCLIAAVAILVNAETLESSFERALLHMRGLVTMVQVCGGLENFNHFRTLQRVITWADFCFSSTWSLPLSFPLLEALSQPLLPVNSQRTLGDELLVMEKSVPGLYICGPRDPLLPIIDLLRSISNAIFLYPKFGGDRTAISNSIYQVEYKLLWLQETRFTQQHTQNPNQVDISGCVSLAALLYLHLAIRELPLNAHRHRRLKEKLFNSLPHDSNLSNAVGSDITLTLLLWAGFISMISATSHEWRDILAKRMGELSTILCLESYEDLVSALKSVLWSDTLFETKAIDIWDQVFKTMQLSSNFTL